MTVEGTPAAQSSGLILIVDDEPFIARALGFLLTREGYRVEIARDGEEGLARIRALRPALVFLDAMMPRLTGYAVAEQVRRDPALAGTYLIMLSAQGRESDRERGLRAGVDEYLAKPFNPREIVSRVRAVFARAQVSAA
jgi:DNA-binding response OmpR family regulator